MLTPPPPPPPPSADGRSTDTPTSGRISPNLRSSVWISNTDRLRSPRSTSSIAMRDCRPLPPYPPPPPTDVNTERISGYFALSRSAPSTCWVTRSVASSVAEGGICKFSEIWFSSSLGAYSEPTTPDWTIQIVPTRTPTPARTTRKRSRSTPGKIAPYPRAIAPYPASQIWGKVLMTILASGRSTNQPTGNRRTPTPRDTSPPTPNVCPAAAAPGAPPKPPDAGA